MDTTECGDVRRLTRENNQLQRDLADSRNKVRQALAQLNSRETHLYGKIRDKDEEILALKAQNERLRLKSDDDRRAIGKFEQRERETAALHKREQEQLREELSSMCNENGQLKLKIQELESDLGRVRSYVSDEPIIQERLARRAEQQSIRVSTGRDYETNFRLLNRHYGSGCDRWHAAYKHSGDAKNKFFADLFDVIRIYYAIDPLSATGKTRVILPPDHPDHTERYTRGEVEEETVLFEELFAPARKRKQDAPNPSFGRRIAHGFPITYSSFLTAKHLVRASRRIDDAVAQ